MTPNPADRKIFSQGDLDGACFLYSLINAYVALTGEDPDFCRVCAAFKQVDFPEDFLCGNRGTTGSFDKRYKRLQENIMRIYAHLGDRTFAVRRIERPLAETLIDEAINPQSVLVARFQGQTLFSGPMDHWVCAVDYDASVPAFAIACSVRFQESFKTGLCNYKELHHTPLNRYSNDVLSPAAPYRFVDGEAFRISLRP